MNQNLRFVVGLLIGLAVGLSTVLVVKSPPRNLRPNENISTTWQVYFSPDGGCTQAIVDELNGARQTVRVQAYSFTSAPIAKALVAAGKRGVRVEAILDRSNNTAKYSAATFLLHADITTYIDAEHAIAHNKVMVIDDQIVITGSFNFTKAAEERNAENLLILHDSALAARYTANWKAHLSHSDVYQRAE